MVSFPMSKNVFIIHSPLPNSKTVLDPMLVKFVLKNAVEKENAGQAEVFAAYRAQMKNLFNTATDLLLKNTKDAIGIGQQFLCLPMHGIIISGHYRLADKDIVAMANAIHKQDWKWMVYWFLLFPLTIHSVLP